MRRHSCEAVLAGVALCGSHAVGVGWPAGAGGRVLRSGALLLPGVSAVDAGSAVSGDGSGDVEGRRALCGVGEQADSAARSESSAQRQMMPARADRPRPVVTKPPLLTRRGGSFKASAITCVKLQELLWRFVLAHAGRGSKLPGPSGAGILAGARAGLLQRGRGRHVRRGRGPGADLLTQAL